ncbi:MAG: hypothetical protein R3E10_16675 [Gemmatimonadota bacterium]
MRARERILANLEELYRGEFERAAAAEESGRMADLDFGYQRDQLYLEVLLDLRALLSSVPAAETATGGSLLDKAEALRRLTRLR